MKIVWYSLLVVLVTIVFLELDVGQNMQIQEAAAISESAHDVVTSGITVQRSFVRGISESLSVTSTFGAPVAPGQSFVRSVSDNVGITTGFSAPQSQVARTMAETNSYRSSQYHQTLTQRAEDRLNLRNLTSSKVEILNSAVKTGVAQHVNLEILSALPSSTDSFFDDMDGSADTSDSDDNSSLCLFDPCVGAKGSNFHPSGGSISWNNGLADTDQVLAVSSSVVIATILIPVVSSGGIRSIAYLTFGCTKVPISITDKKAIQAIILLVVLFLAIPSQVLIPQANAAIIYVGAGTPASSAPNNNGTISPALPSGLQTGDLMVVYFYSRTITGSVSISSGWTQVYNHLSASGLTAVWYRFYESGDSAPTLSASGLATGTPSLRDDLIAQIAAWRGVDTTTPIDAIGTVSSNLAAQDIGPIDGISVGANDVVVVVGGKQDDWSSVATLSGDGLTWQEIGESVSTAGADAGLVWDYAINGASNTTLTSKTFTVSGGSLAAGKGVMFSLNVATSQNFSRTPADSITLTDSAAKAGFFNRSISDTVSITDSLTQKQIIRKSAADTLTLTDFITHNVAAIRSVSDMLVLSDSISADKHFDRAANNSIAFTDSISIILSRSIADSVSISDGTASGLTTSRLISDSVTLAESISITTSRPVVDSISIADSITVDKHFVRSITDFIHATDNVSTLLSAFRTIDDVVTITDSILTRVYRSMADSVVISDSTTVNAVIVRLNSDALTITDGVTRSLAASSSITDTLTLVDSIARIHIASRTTADTLMIDDDISAVKSYNRNVSDAITTADSIAIMLAATRSAGDTITVTDSIATAYFASRSNGDMIAVSDSISAGKHFHRSINDSIATTDVISMIVSRTIADSLNITDIVDPTLAASRSVLESITISDVVDPTLAASRTVSNSIIIADSITVGKHFHRSINDSITVGDNITPAYLASRSLDADLTLTDSISIRISRFIDDSVDLSEDTAVGKHFHRFIEDSIVLTDNIQAAYLAPRLADDLVTITNSISTRVSRSIADSVNIFEGAAVGKHFDRTISDSLPIDDFISITMTRNIIESITTSDTISTSLTAIRPIFESLEIEDAVTYSVDRSTSDTLLVTDDILAEKAFGKSVSDSISIIDNTTTALEASRSLQDPVSVSDSIATAYQATRSISDPIELQDEATGGKSSVREIGDALAVSETTARSTVFSRLAFDELSVSDDSGRTALLSTSVSDDITFTTDVAAGNAFERETSDTLNVSNVLTILYGPIIPLAESVAITDEVAISLGPNRSMTESTAISDFITTSLSTTRTIFESISITEAIGDLFQTSVLDNLEIQDLVEVEVHGRTVELADAVSISILLHVSVNYHLGFGESLTLGECTPFACNQSLNLYEGIALNDEYLPPPKLEESITVSDSIIGAKSFGRTIADSLPLQDKVDFIVKFPTSTPTGGQVPDLRVQITTNKNLVQPMSATSVSGTHTMTSVSDLINRLGVPTAILNTTVPSPNLPTVAVVLPTYHVNMNSTPQLPGKDAMLTVKVVQIPAETPVIVPVNMAATASMNKTPEIPWMRVDFTPNVQSNDFALLITVLDEPPTGAQEPQANLKPMYIDVRWAGTDSSSNALNMSDPSYYKPDGKPTFTFAVTDDWANANNAERDSNGVPLISMNLLDDVTGAWTEISSIDRPLGADENGQYIFVAHLEHFSTYVVTANAVPGTPSGSGSGRTAYTSFAVSLLDSLRVSEQQRVIPIEIIDEFGGRTFSVVIADRLTMSTRPVAYQNFQVSEDVSVSMALIGVIQEGVFPQTTKATFLVRVSNTGDRDESFQLNFWYYDQSGRRAYESVQEIQIGPLQTKEYSIHVPFNSAGIFSIVAEARSVPDGKLLNTTQFTVSIPWLSIYLYSLLSVAIAIIATSAAAVAILLIRRSRS